ncbi:MAG: class I SAM-dependent methyltransferase [Planctomycetota bacterium]
MVSEQADAKNRAFYEEYWSSSFGLRQRLWRAWWDDGYRTILDWAGDLRQRRVLNVFAGHGEDARWLHEHGATVVALDFARSGLQHLRDMPGHAVLPLCADAARIPCRDGSFDLVFVINGLCHTDKSAVLAECQRVLAPGGRILLLDPMRWPHLAILARLLDPFFWRAPHRFLSVGELHRLARSFPLLRHQQFLCLSVVTAIVQRLLPKSRLVARLHAAVTRFDLRLLRWIPILRRIGYLCAAEFGGRDAVPVAGKLGGAKLVRAKLVDDRRT